MNTSEFLRYIGEPLNNDEMMLLFKANNIKYERCNLYYDFIISLNNLVVNTYMGDDVTKTEKDMYNHFEWCFNTIIKNFKGENINFKNNDNLKEYFYHFYEQFFYIEEDKRNNLVKLNKLPELCFKYEKTKTRSDMDTFVEVYRKFDKSLNFK